MAPRRSKNQPASSAYPPPPPPPAPPAAGAAQPKPKKPQMAWNDDLELLLLKTLKDQAEAGKRADGGWAKEAWPVIAAVISEKYGQEVSITWCKSK